MSHVVNPVEDPSLAQPGLTQPRQQQQGQVRSLPLQSSQLLMQQEPCPSASHYSLKAYQGQRPVPSMHPQAARRQPNLPASYDHLRYPRGPYFSSYDPHYDQPTTMPPLNESNPYLPPLINYSMPPVYDDQGANSAALYTNSTYSYPHPGYTPQEMQYQHFNFHYSQHPQQEMSGSETPFPTETQLHYPPRGYYYQ